MSNRLNSALWGLLLLALGGLVLLYNFGLLDAYKLMAAYSVSVVLALVGVAFLVLIVFRQERWMFVLPGVSFLTLGAVVYLSTVEAIAAVWVGAVFLLGIAIGFLLLFLSNRHERWWALLQTGTIAVVALVSLGVGVPPESEHLLGAALFGGFGFSFLLLYLFAGNHRRFLWALLMAGVLAVFAAMLLVAGYGDRSVVVRLWPVALLVLGVYLLARGLTAARKPAPPAARPSTAAEAEPPPPTVSTQAGEPARITRADQAPVGDSATRVGSQRQTPPGRLPEDPAAALDALLEAGPQPPESSPDDA